MHFLKPEKHTRRAFLHRAAQLGMLGAATPLALNLAAMGEAAAATSSDYKALVCIFLMGGNDQHNTLVPYDTANYARYAQIRGAGQGGPLALPRGALEATALRSALALPNGETFALAPGMEGMADLFHAGRLSALLNVGPLVVPMTKQQYDAQQLPRPPKLFSHNDQQSVWLAEGAEGSTHGWGGNIGDLALSANQQSLFTCISASGNTVFLSGRQAGQYQCSVGGAVAIESLRGNQWGHFLWQPAMRTSFERLLRKPHTHHLAEEYSRVVRRSLDAEVQINAALAGVQLQTAFPNEGPLGAQLRIVARLIGARQQLGVRRQVFFVSFGDFDVHDRMSTRQPELVRRLSAGMTAFDAAMGELGVRDQVVAFTASDFGRTFSTNGDGTDHGWGGHQFIMGGAVRGQRFYGTAPPLSVENSNAPQDQWHVGQGRLLPTTSVDQYAATLGRWFGASSDDLHRVLPFLKNYGERGGRQDYPTDLGFLR
jgi:uncharacterized protein (DUF1501 family)